MHVAGYCFEKPPLPLMLDRPLSTYCGPRPVPPTTPPAIMMTSPAVQPAPIYLAARASHVASSCVSDRPVFASLPDTELSQMRRQPGRSAVKSYHPVVRILVRSVPKPRSLNVSGRAPPPPPPLGTTRP